MVTVTDKNRDDIIRSYCHELLSNMDFDTLYSFAYDMLVDSKDLMDNEPLEDEIKDYYPQILEN